jgi:hypothetical protein
VQQSEGVAGLTVEVENLRRTVGVTAGDLEILRQRDAARCDQAA